MVQLPLLPVIRTDDRVEQDLPSCTLCHRCNGKSIINACLVFVHLYCIPVYL